MRAWAASIFTRKRERRQRFAARSLLDSDVIAREFYPHHDADDVIFLWEALAFHLGIEARKLRPTDRFQAELAPPPGMELLDEIEDATLFVRVEAEKRGKRVVPEELQSIDDVIWLLAKPARDATRRVP